jgi:hypothetical protein
MPDRELVCCGLDLELWPIAKQFLAKSVELAHGAFDLDDIHTLLVNKDAQLWAVHDGEIKAVAVTQIMIYPKQKRLKLFLLGGNDMAKWEKSISDTFDNFAKANGCDGVELYGRKGWLRNLKQFGYNDYEVTMIKTFKSCEGPQL